MSEARPVSATDRVFRSLREDIVAGRLPAGSHYSIYRLADDLGVSRTPVREAVLRLADLGLVTIERNRGIQIRGVTVDDVRAVFELRVLLETPAAAHAAAHADAALTADLRRLLGQMREAAASDDIDRFATLDRALHARLGAVLGNAHWEEQMHRLRDAIVARGVSTIGRSRPMRAIADEHEPIVAAVEAGDAAAAAVAMTDHLVHTARLLAGQIAAERGQSESAAAAETWEAQVRALVAPRVGRDTQSSESGERTR